MQYIQYIDKSATVMVRYMKLLEMSHCDSASITEAMVTYLCSLSYLLKSLLVEHVTERPSWLGNIQVYNNY